MKILHTVEFYPPSIGGMQEVVKQLSERLVRRGHDVTVATARIPERTADSQNGVKIREFDISGNLVNGLKGEVQRYEDFLLSSDFDIVTNFAAQQWATDIMLPVLDRIRAKKVFVPTGFSRFYSPEYRDYFVSMKSWLKKYDVNVFLSNSYRDIDFARENGATNLVVIPNGAGEDEFLRSHDISVRRLLGIPEDDFFILHVGSHSGAKGHREAIEIFERARIKGATFLMIGNFSGPSGDETDESGRKENLMEVLKTCIKKLLLLAIRVSPWSKRKLQKLSLFDGSQYDNSLRGQLAKRVDFFFYLAHLDKHGVNCPGLCRVSERRFNGSAQLRRESKRLLIRSLSREETVAAYREADLFLFPSNIECSPLVLFECMASRTPFLTTDVGNSVEIIEWSHGAGMLLPTLRNGVGDARADIKASARMLERVFRDGSGRREMANRGFNAWQEKFGWDKITGEYEALYSRLLSPGGGSE
jgi:L-malate glycosyltransferase